MGGSSARRRQDAFEAQKGKGPKGLALLRASLGRGYLAFLSRVGGVKPGEGVTRLAKKCGGPSPRGIRLIRLRGSPPAGRPRSGWPPTTSGLPRGSAEVAAGRLPPVDGDEHAAIASASIGRKLEVVAGRERRSARPRSASTRRSLDFTTAQALVADRSRAAGGRSARRGIDARPGGRGVEHRHLEWSRGLSGLRSDAAAARAEPAAAPPRRPRARAASARATPARAASRPRHRVTSSGGPLRLLQHPDDRRVAIVAEHHHGLARESIQRTDPTGRSTPDERRRSPSRRRTRGRRDRGAAAERAAADGVVAPARDSSASAARGRGAVASRAADALPEVGRRRAAACSRSSAPSSRDRARARARAPRSRASRRSTRQRARAAARRRW